jgi:hypothetical protein
MSRSYKKNYKSPVCCVGRKGMKKWKHDTKQQRRARERAQLFKIYEDEEGFDEESCTPIKYQKQKDMTDWSGPHDGWNRMSVRAAEEMWDEIDGKPYKGHRK